MDIDETDYCQQVRDYIDAKQCVRLQGRSDCCGCKASIRHCLGCGRPRPLKDARQGTCETCCVARQPVIDDVLAVRTMLDYLEAALDGFPWDESELPAIPAIVLPPSPRRRKAVSVRLEKATQPGMAAVESISPEARTVLAQMQTLDAERIRLEALIAAKQQRLHDLRQTLAAWQASIAQLRTLLATAET